MAAIEDIKGGFRKSTIGYSDFDTGRSVNRAGRMFFGTALIISALGLWLVPVAGNDAAMQLIKLLMSTALLCLGMMFIMSIDHNISEPEIQIDVETRTLHVIRPGKLLSPVVRESYNLDELSDFCFEDSHLVALNADGQTVFRLPVHDHEAAKNVEAALHLIT